MARIPDFTSLGATPAPQTPLSVARVDTQPLEFEVRQGPGEAMMRGGKEVSDAGIQMQDRIDTLKAEDAYNKLLATKNELETSPDKGFVNVKGSSAIDKGFYDGYTKQFSDATTGIAGTLANGNQRQLFMNRAQVAGSQYQSALLSHMSQQTSAFADNTEKTSVHLETVNASNAPNDAAFDTSLTRIRGILDARGSRLHQPPAEIELDKQQAVGSAWTERIKTTMNDNPLLAQKMYETNKSMISPADKVTLEHQLHQAILPIQAKNVAMSVIAGAKVGDIVQAVTVGGDNVLNNLIVQQAQADDGAPQTKVNTKANLFQWINDADEAAQKIKPNDPVFRDLVVQQVKGYVGTIVAAQDGVSKMAHSILIAAAMGDATHPAPLKPEDLLTTPDLKAAWAVTSPEAKHGILAILDSNLRKATGDPIRVNSHVVEEAFNRIHLPATDPNKITSITQLTPLFGHGVNEPYYKFLKDELAHQQTEDGRNLTSTREDYLKSVKGQFDKSNIMNVDGEGAERFNKFRTFVLTQEAAARASGGKVDPYDLYNYKSPNYISNKIPSFQSTLDAQIHNLSDKLKQPVSVPNQATPKVEKITATNPSTGAKLISTDGGKTWQTQ